MYHPTRGGVRGGRDQFSWDDVKVDKHRENYLGHSIKAPVGRWQKGKDLHRYNRDRKTWSAEIDAAKEENKRITEEEDQAMREALGLAPKHANQAHGNRLDKFSELVRRGSTAEDLGEGHAEAAHVHGLGFSRAPVPLDDPSSLQYTSKGGAPGMGDTLAPNLSPKGKVEKESKDESSRRKRRYEERKHEKHERREKHNKHEKQQYSVERKLMKDKKRRH